MIKAWGLLSRSSWVSCWIVNPLQSPFMCYLLQEATLIPTALRSLEMLEH